jgi:G patch domain-containing protein 1
MQEGWAPSTFKSSRSERASAPQQQRPEDYMDEDERAALAATSLGVKVRGALGSCGDW